MSKPQVDRKSLVLVVVFSFCAVSNLVFMDYRIHKTRYRSVKQDLYLM